MVDESGGGSYHNIDYIEFPTEVLKQLFLLALGSPVKQAGLKTSGLQTTDYENWPYGSDSGSSIHTDKEAVGLEIFLTITGSGPILSLAHTYGNPNMDVGKYVQV